MNLKAIRFQNKWYIAHLVDRNVYGDLDDQFPPDVKRIWALDTNTRDLICAEDDPEHVIELPV